MKPGLVIIPLMLGLLCLWAGWPVYGPRPFPTELPTGPGGEPAIAPEYHQGDGWWRKHHRDLTSPREAGDHRPFTAADCRSCHRPASFCRPCHQYVALRLMEFESR